MQEIKTEILIQAPQERVWRILMDFEKYSTWNPFIVSLEGIPMTGETLVAQLSLKGRTITFKPKIVEISPFQNFEWSGSLPLGLFKGNHYFTLERVSSDQTKFIHGERFTGLLHGLIIKRIGEAIHQNFLNMNEALKARAEQAT